MSLIKTFIILLFCFANTAFSERILYSDILSKQMLENNQKLLRLKSELDESQLLKEIGVFGKDPELRFEYGRETDVSIENRSSDYHEEDYDMAFRVFPMNPWEKKAEKSKVDAFYKLLYLEYRLEESALLFQLISLCNQLNHEQEQLSLIRVLVKNLEDRVSKAQVLLSNGQIKSDDFLTLSSKQLALQYKSHEAENQLYDLCFQIEELSGVEVPIDSRIVLDEELLEGQSIFSEEALIASIDKHNKLQRFTILREMTEYDKDRLEALKIPWFNHVQLAHSVENDFGEQDSTSIQFALSVPVFSWYKKEERIPRQKLRDLEKRERLCREQLIQKIKSSYAQFKNTEEQYKNFKDQVEPILANLREKIQKTEQYKGSAMNQGLEERLLELKSLESKMRHDYIESLIEYKSCM